MRARSPRLIVTVVAALASGASACGASVEGLPEGALARVGPRVVEPSDLDELHAQLGAYGQRRFAGVDGKRAMLDAALARTLLEVEAESRGMASDPRVEFAVLEEIARVQLSSEIEREVPVAEIAADLEALRAYYEAHPESFHAPERRSAELVACGDLDAADAALARLRREEVTFEELGPRTKTAPVERDDERYPAFHRYLFDPARRVGDLLPAPVYASQRACVARVAAIEGGKPLPFDSPGVQEQLVAAVRAPAAAQVRERLLAELREAEPVEPVAPRDRDRGLPPAHAGMSSDPAPRE